MLEIITFTADLIQAHQSVAEGTYENPEVVNPNHIRWKHLDNPFGASTAISIPGKANEPEVLGRSFIVARDFKVDTKTSIPGSTVTDLVIQPHYRNAARLIALVKASKSFHNTKITIHSSNEVSDVFYRKMFKFPVRFSLASSGFPVRLQGFLINKSAPAFLAKIIDFIYTPIRWVTYVFANLLTLMLGFKVSRMPTHEELDEIHEGHHHRTGPQFVRNRDYVNWRFLDGPISKSNVHGVFDRKAKCIGYFATRKVELNNIPFTILMDIATTKKLTAGQRLCLKFSLIKITIKNGSEIAFAMFNPNHDELSWLNSFPFVKVPDSVLPHPTPIFIHQHEALGEINGLNEMYFTLADLDYF